MDRCAKLEKKTRQYCQVCEEIDQEKLTNILKKFDQILINF